MILIGTIIGRNGRSLLSRAVAVRHGRIADLGAVDNVEKRYHTHKKIYLHDTILLPGLINVHTHLELPALLGSIRSPTLPEWVLNLLRVKGKLTPADYHAAAMMNIETCIRSGTTTIGEISTHDISPDLLKKSGLRATVFRELISMDPSSPLPDLSSLVSRPSSLVQRGLSPHAPHTVSEKALKEIRRFSDRKNIRLAMHVAESRDEVRLLQGKKSGFDRLYKMAGWERAWAPQAGSPFTHLQAVGLLGPRLLAVHAVRATKSDVQLLKDAKAPVAHCARSNKETAVGRMRLHDFLDAGITVGLGTDSLASSPTLSMWDEMRYAYKIHKRDGLSARDIFRLATFGGAKALGLDHEVGSLERGKRADIIAVPLPSKLTGDIYSDLLRETNSCIMSMVNGKILYRAPSLRP